MPQLDRLSWLTVIVWFVFFFFSFYLLVVKFIFPSIASNLKLRNKLLLKLNASLSTVVNDISWRNEVVRLYTTLIKSVEQDFVLPLYKALTIADEKFLTFLKESGAVNGIFMQTMKNLYKRLRGKSKF